MSSFYKNVPSKITIVSRQNEISFVLNFSGDSMTAVPNGYVTDEQAYPSLVLQSLGDSRDLNDTALAGWRMDQLVDSDTTNADPKIVIGKNNILSIFAGSNDFGNNNETPEQIMADFVLYCSTRRAAGWNKIVVATMLPRNDSHDMVYPNFEPNRIAFNTLLRNGFSPHADGLIDIGADSIMGNVDNIDNTLYFVDGVHPTALGHSILAPYFFNAINFFI